MSPRIAILALICAAALGAACKEDGTVAVHSITFTGVTHVDVARLKSSLATRENTEVPIFGWQLPWARKNAFDRGRFDADLQRITAFYADRGYPNAKVTHVDVKPNANQSAVDVSLAIDEGEPVRIAAVEFRGFESLSAKQLELLRERVGLSVGAPRDRQAVTLAHEAAVNELRDQGYPYARVSTDEDDGPLGRAATIVFSAEPGPLAHFGDIQISGNASVNRTVIDRQLTFKPGDLYRRSLVQESQRQLYALELFQFVNVEALEPELKSAVVKMRITVTEGKHHRVNFGVGYGTDEKGRVDAEYHQLNFLGGARSAGAHARWSSLDRGLRLDFVQPHFVAPHLSLGGEAQQWYTYTPAYRSLVTGVKATLTHRQSQRFSWSFSVGSEHNNSSIEPDVLNDPVLYADLIALGLDPTTGTQAGTLSSLGFDVQRNTTANPLNAHRGTQLAVHTEEAGRLLPGTFNYYALSVDGRHYWPVGSKLVLANRIQLGAINAFGTSAAQVPFSKKYFLGGATSIRGWGRYEVSPLSGSGLPIGGNSLLALSSEARVELSSHFGVVAFVDGGNVWPGGRQITPSDLRYAAGSGLRYQTPVGPIRVDVGYQLNPIPDLKVDGQPQARRWRLHFSIGQAF